MKVDIVVTSWKMIENEDKSKTIGGSYEVRCGGKKIAGQTFNNGYGSEALNIPSKLMVRAEEIEKDVLAAIIASTGSESGE